MKNITLSLVLLLSLAACDSTGPDASDLEYVVDALLVANEPLPPIRLNRTASIGSIYDPEALGVTNAEVQLYLTGNETSELYREQGPGEYLPVNPEAIVRPLGTYRLDILIPETNTTITGTTTVPDSFRVLSTTQRSVVYQGDEQLELTITRSSLPEDDQNYFIFVTEALDPRVEQLTPFASSILDNDDDEDALNDLRINGSPIVSEGNYDLNPDGTLTIRYPWIGINFFGPNRIRINVLDNNLYDFLRSQSVQQGGSTFAPGEIPNPLEPVVGAHGVFGSYARISFDLLVLR